MAGPTAPLRELLVVRHLGTGYGRKPVLFDVSLTVRPGEIVAVLGHNGAGKTTALRTVFGLLPAWEGEIWLSGESVGGWSTAERVRRGIGFVPQEHCVFPDLTVAENLELGAFSVSDRRMVAARRERVWALLPLLAERRRQLAGTLSGGEQRMLGLGMALMAEPRLLLLDEPSLGLAPRLVERLMETIAAIARTAAMTVLLVEQNVTHALQIADRVYVMRTGRVILEASSQAMAARGSWWDLF